MESCLSLLFFRFLSIEMVKWFALEFPGTTLTPSKARLYYTINLDRLISNDKS